MQNPLCMISLVVPAATPVLGRQKQEELELETSLACKRPCH